MQPRIDKLLAESLWVRRIAYGLLRDAHEAEDVAQEVLTAAYEQQPTATGNSLRAWLWTVTKRKALRKKQQRRSRSLAEKRAARGESEESPVADRLALHELLAKAVGELPPLLGEAVMLRYFDDLAPRQIAKKLGVTSEVARQRVSRGLRILRQRLDDDADPKDPERGRALWSAALIETLYFPKLAAVSALSPLLLMSLIVKVLCAGAACLVGLLIFLQIREARVAEPVDRQPPHAVIAELTKEQAAPQIASAPATDEKRESVTSSPAAVASRTLSIRSMTPKLPNNTKAVWVDEDGAPHSLTVDDSCHVDLENVPVIERIWVAADDHLTAFIDLETNRSHFEVTLDPGLTVHGLLIEDGGIPRARTTFRAHWDGTFAQELEMDRVSEELSYELGLGRQGKDIHPDAQGAFALTAILPGTPLRFWLPSSHLFESDLAGVEQGGMWCNRQAVEGQSIRLETLRTLSISARVLRADNGRPARYASGSFSFQRENGDRRSRIDEESDSQGYFSEGYHPEGWREMTAEERAQEVERWNYASWYFSSNDPSLGTLKGSRNLEPDEYFIDLGDVYLEARPTLDAVVYGADEMPLARAAVTEFGLDILHTDKLGRVKLPSTAMERGIRVLALGHAIRHFTPAELTPSANGVIPLRLEAGIELHLSMAKESYRTLEEAGVPMGDYRICVSWQTTPFMRSPRQRSPLDNQLHSDLLEYDESLGGLQQGEGPQTGTTYLPDTGIVRLLSLRPGVPITVQLRRMDASILYSVDLTTPRSPGRHELKLGLQKTLAGLRSDQFRITGQVVDENSLPIPEASLMYDIGDVRGYLEADSEGKFEGGPLPKKDWPTEDSFDLWVGAEGHVQLHHEWSERSPDDLLQLRFVLPRSRRIELRASYAEGTNAAIEGATLIGYPNIKFEGQARSEGTWFVERAPLLDLRLQLQVAGRTYPLTLGANEAIGHLTVPAEDP